VKNPHAAARELEWVGSEYMLRWLARTPDTTTIASFGAARGVLTPEFADVDFLNTVHRLLPDDTEQVPRIAAHYAEAGVQPWFELMPAPGFDRLAGALAEAGGRQVGFLAMSERDLPAPPVGPLPVGVTVEVVGADVEDFARVLPEGHGVPAGWSGSRPPRPCSSWSRRSRTWPTPRRSTCTAGAAARAR